MGIQCIHIFKFCPAVLDAQRHAQRHAPVVDSLKMRWPSASSSSRRGKDDDDDDGDDDGDNDGNDKPSTSWRTRMRGTMRKRMKKKTVTQKTSWHRSEDDGRMVSSTVDPDDPDDALKLARAERDAAKLDAERYKNELNRVNRERALERASLTDELASSAERVSRQRSEIERLKEEKEIATAAATTSSANFLLLDGICRTVTAFTAEFADAGLVERETARRVAENPKIWIAEDNDDGEDNANNNRIGDLLRAILDAHESVCADYEEKIARAEFADVEARAEVERLLGELEIVSSQTKKTTTTTTTKNGGGGLLYRTPDVVAAKSQKKTTTNSNREAEAELRELREELEASRRETHQLAESSKDVERELRQQLNEVLEERDVVIKNLKVELEQLERAETERRGVAARAKEAEIANLNALVEDLTAEVKRLKDTLTKQRQLKEKLEERLAGSEARIEGLLQEIDAMDAASAQASEHVSNAMTSAAEAHARAMGEMRAKMAEAEAYIEALDARESSMEDERSVLKRELDKAYAREKDLRCRIQDTEKRSNALTDEINALLEQDARRNNAVAAVTAGYHHHHHPQPQPRLTRVTSSTKKLDVREISDDDEDDDDEEDYFVVQRRSKTAPNTPLVTSSSSPLSPRQLNGLNSVNSALARARAELNAARAKRDRNVRKLELL